jgi:hypothetical protein
MVLEVRTDRCDEPLKQPLHGDVVNGLGVVTDMVHLGRPSTKGHPRAIQESQWSSLVLGQGVDAI